VAAPARRDRLALFPATEGPLAAALKAIDVDGLTPREALARLAELQTLARERDR